MKLRAFKNSFPWVRFHDDLLQFFKYDVKNESNSNNPIFPILFVSIGMKHLFVILVNSISLEIVEFMFTNAIKRTKFGNFFL